MLVVGDQQQRVVPARTVSHRVIGIVNQLLAERDVVVGMLAVAAGAEARLEKSIGGQRAGGAPGLEIAEMAEMALVGVLGVGEIQPRQRIAVVAVDRPIDILVAKPSENAGAGENLDVIVEMALAGRGGRKGAVGDRLGRNRRKPVIANRKSPRQAGHDRQHLRRVHAHDLRRVGSRQRILEALGMVGCDRRLEVDDEPPVGRHRAGRRIVRREQLIIGVEEALARDRPPASDKDAARCRRS